VLHYNLGATCYRMNRYEEAAKNYEAAAARTTDTKLRERAYYNLGNCAYRMGKPDEAVTWYQKAIELDPNDEDARYNIEFVREEMQRRKNQEQERQEGEETGEDKKNTGEQGKPKGSGEGKPEGGGDRNKPPQEDMGEKGKGAEDQRIAQPHEDPNGPVPPRQGDARSEGDETEEKGTPAFGMQINPGEAERLLETMHEERGKPSEKKEDTGVGPYTPEKDW